MHLELRKYLLPFRPQSISVSENEKFKIYKIIILPVVLYGHETWSLTSRVKHGLRLFSNRVLRKGFGPKRVNFYCLPILFWWSNQEEKVCGACSMHGREKRGKQGLTGET